MNPDQHGLTFAIGDIHGRADLLEIALNLIGERAAGGPARIITLGDMIDRGPQSRSVVQRLMDLERTGVVECLKGNHEDMMLDACRGHTPGALSLWLANGGRETLASYGVGRGDPDPNAVSQGHLDWIAALPLSARDDHRIYVHAGLAPTIALALQRPAALLWIRELFLEARAEEFEAHVVHGHTPFWAGKPSPGAPELLAHRTNLDTAAWSSGVLTVGVFASDRPGGPIELLFARAKGRWAWRSYSDEWRARSDSNARPPDS